MFKRDITVWIKYISLCLAISENEKFNKMLTIIHSTVCLIGISGSIIAFLNVNVGADKLAAFTGVITPSFAMLIFLNLNLFKKKITTLLGSLEKDRICTVEISRKMNQLLMKRLTWFVLATLLLTTLYMITILYVSFQKDAINMKESFVIPFWLTCNTANKSNGIGSICWNINTKARLFATNCIQWMILMVTIGEHLVSFLLFSITITELLKHVENIKSEIHNYKKSITPKVLKVALQCIKDEQIKISQLNKEAMLERFVENFKYQQFLRRRTLQVVDTWKGFFTLYSASFNCGLLPLLFIIRVELYGSQSFAFRAFLAGSFLITAAFIIAYISQIISDLNDDIFQELANIPWYDQSIKFRKIYLTSLILNQTSIKVKVAGVVELNLDTFGKMMKTVYSILNLLLLRYGN